MNPPPRRLLFTEYDIFNDEKIIGVHMNPTRATRWRRYLDVKMGGRSEGVVRKKKVCFGGKDGKIRCGYALLYRVR